MGSAGHFKAGGLEGGLHPYKAVLDTRADRQTDTQLILSVSFCVYTLGVCHRRLPQTELLSNMAQTPQEQAPSLFSAHSWTSIHSRPGVFRQSENPDSSLCLEKDQIFFQRPSLPTAESHIRQGSFPRIRVTLISKVHL